MKRKIALLLTAAMLIGMNSVVYAVESVDERIDGQAEITTDAETDKQTEIPADAEDGEQEEIPTDAEDGEQEEISADAEDGGQEEIPADAEAGEQEKIPADEETVEEVESVPDAEMEETGGQGEMESQTKTVKNVQAERTVKDESGTSITQGSEIEAGLYRWLEPETSVQVAKGGSKHIYTNVSRKFDENLYEYYNDNDHVFSSMLYNSSGTSIKIDGNTSSDTKIIADDLITEWGFFEGFDVQVGEDETAEEITITVSLGEWSYYLRNKETGEIIHVSGNDGGRKATVTLKIVDVADEFSFTRELIADKASVDYGEETAVRMGYRLIYDANKYTIYNDTGHFWYLGIKSCIVSGNMSENTKIEDRKDYANIRYLVVGEDETAEELTITMECSGWTYWLKNKETEELLRIHSDESESLQIVIRVGAEKTSDSEQGEIEEKEIFTGSESGTEEEDAADDSQQITFANTVTGAGGIKIVSTIDGIYQVTDIAGVAVTTPKEQVETAAGITAGDGKVKFYVCNNRNQAARTALEEAAASNGKQALTTFNLDLYAISMAGQVNKIYNTASKVKVVIGIPDKYKKSDGSYAVGIIGRDGTFHILEDLDNDPNTITIETDQFGIMALMKG